jgi:hypothetical protein
LARTPFSEILRAVGDGLGSTIDVKTAVPADAGSYAAIMQPAVQQVIEAQLQPIAQRIGTTARRANHSPGKVGGKAGISLYNARWTAAKGMKPGFTVLMHHEKKNVRILHLGGRVTYPVAGLAGLAVGLLFEFFWLPWLSGNFGAMFSGGVIGGLYIGGILFSMGVLYWLIVKVANIMYIGLGIVFVCAAGAVALSFGWGFIGGLLLGWTITTRVMNGGAGRAMREELGQALQRATAAVMAMPPPVYMAPAMAPPPFPAAAAPRYHPPPAMPMGSGAARYAPAAQPTRYGPPANTTPMAARYAQPPAYAQAQAPQLYPCPTCGSPVPDGAPACGACRNPLQWG